MKANGHTGHRLEDLSGVPSATTYRFLRGVHANPDVSTIRKWAEVYGVSETQLLGNEPIQGVLIPPGENQRRPVDNDLPHLTKEEKTILKIARKINRESKRAWLKIGIDLSSPPESKEEAADIKLMLVDAAWPQRGKERRAQTDRRARQAYGGSTYGPAKNSPEASGKGGKRA